MRRMVVWAGCHALAVWLTFSVVVLGLIWGSQWLT